MSFIPESWINSLDGAGGFYVHNGLMILPPMALISVGILIWIQRSKNTKLIENN
jgi:Na+-transporting NADH:ubiquinone oxidoreductase subunit D